jgi:hypothetical protein
MPVPQISTLAEESSRLISQFDTGAGRGLERQIEDAARPSLSSVVASIDEAGATANRSFDTAEGVFERQQRGLGRPVSEREQAVSQRRLGLSRALADVGARERRERAISERTDVARTSAASLRDIIEGQRTGILGTAAQTEAGREQQYQADRVQHAQQRSAGLGSLVGLGLSFATGGVGGLALGALSAAG